MELLYHAIKENKLHIVRLLINFGADVNFKYKNKSLLYLACTIGNLEIVKLIGEKCNNDIILDADNCAIEAAAINGYTHIVKYLLEVLKCPPRRTMYYAIHYGWIDMVEYLITKKGIIDLDTIIDNPLYIACQVGNIDIIDILMQNNAELLWDKNRIAGPIQIVCENGRLDILKRLVIYGIDYTFVNLNRMTGLSYATLYLHQNIVEFLIDLNADINITNCVNKSALFYACERNSYDIAKLLIDAGANTNIIDFSDKSALFSACDNNNYDIVKLLLDTGADTTIIDENGKSAIQYTKDSCIRDLFKLY